MSAPTPATDVAGGTTATRRRRHLVVLVTAVVMLIAAALAAGPPPPGRAYDPRSPGPDGLAGLVELLRSVDVDVEVSRDPPVDVSTRLFIANDRLRDDERARIVEWVEQGGTVVVAGRSPVHGLDVAAGPVADVFGATSRAPACTAPALADVGEVGHAAWDPLTVGADDAAELTCFPLGDGQAWMVLLERGRGTVVALGSGAAFVNANLDRADNAVLAAVLLAPAPRDRVVVVPPPGVGEGGTGVLDLVPVGFWRLLTLLTVAVLLAVVWRARRLGRPVEERLPPVLPSAELARSVAGLLQRSGDRAGAAARLRQDLRRTVERAVGAPHDTDAAALVALVVARTSVDAVTAELALLDRPTADDAALTELARAAADVRGALRSPAHATHLFLDTSMGRHIDQSTHRPRDTPDRYRADPGGDHDPS